MSSHYDVAIIGAGQAAPALGVALAHKGEKVALIEGNLVGGSCVNVGCTPTKTLRKTARVAHMANRAADFGVQTGPVSVDFSAAMARMHERVKTSRTGLEAWLEGTQNLSVLRGWASFVGRKDNQFDILVGQTQISANRVYINSGTRPFIPPIDGLEDIEPLDNETLLGLETLPEHLVVVGGGYIGLEMGQIFRRLGSKVTILNNSSRVAGREDEDVSQTIEQMFADEGISIVQEVNISRVSKSDQSTLIELSDGAQIECSHILFATGRIPNSDKLNLPAIGVETDGRGYVKTDASLATNVKNVWALGDINGRGAFTHTSYHDHEIVLAAQTENIQASHQWQDVEQRPTTYAMYTDPPLGRVGMSLAEARVAASNGRNILVGERLMSNISRAKEESETTGLIRLIVDANSEQILGATVFGIAGDEIIAVLSNFMATGASYRVMQQALPVHPTVAELLPTILGSMQPLDAG